MFERVITLCVFRRLDYTRQVLTHLSRCRGIEDYVVLISAEPGFPEVIKLCKEFDLGCRSKIVEVNRIQLGCTRNTLRALDRGFDVSDFVVHVEDDILLAKDALEYFEWAGETFWEDPEVFTATAYSKDPVTQPLYHHYRRDPWFTPWGWATWKDRYLELRGEILCRMHETDDSWDIITNHRARQDRVQIVPYLARSQNIGALDGTYCPGPEWHRLNVLNQCWSGMEGLELLRESWKLL